MDELSRALLPLSEAVAELSFLTESAIKSHQLACPGVLCVPVTLSETKPLNLRASPSSQLSEKGCERVVSLHDPFSHQWPL